MRLPLPFSLPYVFVVTPPEAPELLAAARCPWPWTVGVGLGLVGAVGCFHLGLPVSHAAPAMLQVSSSPPGAAVLVDGRTSGVTPATIAMPPGDHRVLLRTEDAKAPTRTLHLQPGVAVSLHEQLWLHMPEMQRIRPPLPGAAITDATFLENGDLALALTLPPGHEHQLWLRAPTGALRLVGPPLAPGPLRLSPDGNRIAFLASSTRPGTSGLDTRLDEVWTMEHGGAAAQRQYGLSPTSSERLVDLVWASDGQHLVLVSRQQQSGAQRSRLLWLAADPGIAGAEPRELVRLPGEVLPGSSIWSPDGRRFAFLVRTAQGTALCLLDVQDGAFRSVADVSPGAGAQGEFTFPVVAWSPDSQQVLYAARGSDDTRGLWPLRASLDPALFLLDLTQPGTGAPLGQARGLAPAWRSDDTLLTLARPRGNGPLVLQALAATGEPEELATLPLPTGEPVAVRWDVAHAQALIALRPTGGLGLATARPDLWLIRFRPQEAPQ